MTAEPALPAWRHGVDLTAFRDIVQTKHLEHFAAGPKLVEIQPVTGEFALQPAQVDRDRIAILIRSDSGGQLLRRAIVIKGSRHRRRRSETSAQSAKDQYLRHTHSQTEPGRKSDASSPSIGKDHVNAASIWRLNSTLLSGLVRRAVLADVQRRMKTDAKAHVGP